MCSVCSSTVSASRSRDRDDRVLVRIRRRRRADVLLELAQGRVRALGLPVDVERRCVVDSGRERGLACRQQRTEVRVDLADLVRRARRDRRDRRCLHVVCAVRRDAVRVGVTCAAGEVVALVDGDDEERIALVDAVGLQTIEERRRTRRCSRTAAADSPPRRGRRRVRACGCRARRRCTRTSPARRSPASARPRRACSSRAHRRSPGTRRTLPVGSLMSVPSVAFTQALPPRDRRVDVLGAEQRLVALVRSRDGRRLVGLRVRAPARTVRCPSRNGSRCRRSRPCAGPASSSSFRSSPCRTRSRCRHLG